MTITGTTTVEQLAALVENYYGLTERIDKLEKTKEVTEKLILEAFCYTAMKTFTTPSGLIASICFKQSEIDKWEWVLKVSRIKAERLSAHSLESNMHFQNQG